MASTNDSVKLNIIKYRRILFGGDQLTSCRARSIQRTMRTSDTPELRCSGLLPVTEDWHCKVVLLEVSNHFLISIIMLIQVIWKRLFSLDSGDQHGTLYQLRNLIHRTVIKKK